MAEVPIVFVHIVTYNSAETIASAVLSIASQEGFTLGENLLLQITDNASHDETRTVINTQYCGSQISGRAALVENTINKGFTGAHNEGITTALATDAEYVLLLNPDVRLKKNALSHLVAALEADSQAGSACPKLHRAEGPELEPVVPARFDSTGMFITPSIRHFDRGSEELDAGQYDCDEYVFGASGAAVLMRRSFLWDVAKGRTATGTTVEVFDEAFFAYREDADLAWRAQWLGWKCRYVPAAAGYHRRTVLPERRASLPKELNAYSVRNRFLLQANNWQVFANLRCIPAAVLRNVLVVGAACTNELSSFGALSEAIRLFPRALRRRHALLRRKRVSPWEMARWFRSYPYAEPALPVQPPAKSIRSIVAIVVNFNSGNRLTSCLRSLLEARSGLSGAEQLSVCIVDNRSHDKSAERAEAAFSAEPSFRFDFARENLGFAAAINRVCASHPADAYLILNPDVEVREDTLSLLRNALDFSERLGAAGPIFTAKNGDVQYHYTFGRLPRLGQTIAELFGLHAVFGTLFRELSQGFLLRRYLIDCSRTEPELTTYDGPYLSPERPFLVEQPAAACLMVRGSAMRTLGGFDPSFWPAWYEDVDFCKRLRDCSYLSAVVGKARVQHEGGYSVRKLPAHRFVEIYYGNLLKFWKKHGTPAEYSLLRLLIPFALLLRSAASYLKALLGAGTRKSARRRELLRSRALLRTALGGIGKH